MVSLPVMVASRLPNSFGLTTVPTLRINHLDAAAKRAYALADNRLAELAGWDRDTLSIELQELSAIGYEVEITGFITAEINSVLNEPAEASANSPAPEDEIPDFADDPAVRPGDLWILGNHRILCGDASHQTNYRKLLDGEKADLVFIDLTRDLRVWEVNARNSDFFKSVLGNAAAVSRDGALQLICVQWSALFEALSAGREVYDGIVTCMRLE